jgi:hypothetical protein
VGRIRAVRFRLSLTVLELSLHPDGVEPLVLSLHKHHDLQVTLATREVDGEQLECVVETEFDPGGRVLKPAFEALAAGRLPPKHLPREEWGRDFHYIDADGNIREGYVVPLHIMPEAFRNFAKELSAEMNGAAADALGVIRWRSRTLGEPRPLATRGIEWSIEADEWHRLPMTTSLQIGAADRLEISEAAASEIQALLDDDELEPLAHVLFREAWSQRFANPRSSLLIGVAALEVGVKHYISACVAEARWLAENAPSPPVVRMLEEYLPKLQPPDGGTPLQPFDDKITGTLKDAVERRNKSTHLGLDVPRDRLMRILRAIRYVLWTLDEARGHDWAAQHRSPSLDKDPSVGYRLVRPERDESV